MTDLLNIHNLKVEFDTDEGRILAVDNVILKLQEGQILGLLKSFISICNTHSIQHVY